MPQALTKRRFDRFLLSQRLEIARQVSNYVQTIPGLMMEISEGGFSTMLTDGLQIGEVVDATFHLPGTGRITVNAVVRNKDLFRYGFEFVEPSVKLVQQIKQGCEGLPRYRGGWY